MASNVSILGSLCLCVEFEAVGPLWQNKGGRQNQDMLQDLVWIWGFFECWTGIGCRKADKGQFWCFRVHKKHLLCVCVFSLVHVMKL